MFVEVLTYTFWPHRMIRLRIHRMMMIMAVVVIVRMIMAVIMMVVRLCVRHHQTARTGAE